MRKLSVLMLIPILTAACVMIEEIPYEATYAGEKIVVHGLVSPNRGVEVIVKKLLPPNLPFGNDTIAEALVLLFENDMLKDTLKPNDEFVYLSSPSTNIEEGKHYKIQVSSHGLPTVVSSNQLLSEANIIDSVKVQIGEASRGFIHVWFTHSPENQVGYQVTYDYYDENPHLFVPGRRNVIEPLEGANHVTLDIGFSSSTNWQIGDSLLIGLHTLSFDLKEFVISQRLNEINRDDPYASPYLVYSNIDGGFGVFGAYNSSYLVVKIE